MDLNDLIECCKAQALSHKLYPTEESNYRWFCREYSKTFHTPLHEVFEMDAEHVMLCVLEENLDQRRLNDREDFEAIVKDLRRLEDPDYDINQTKDFDDFVSGIEEWEKDRKNNNYPLPSKKIINNEKNTKEMPKSGYINLAYLENSQNEK